MFGQTGRTNKWTHGLQDRLSDRSNTECPWEQSDVTLLVVTLHEVFMFSEVILPHLLFKPMQFVV